MRNTTGELGADPAVLVSGFGAARDDGVAGVAWWWSSDERGLARVGVCTDVGRGETTTTCGPCIVG